MIEDTENSASSPATVPAISLSQKRKRKKSLHESPGSLNHLDSPKAAKTRAKRAPRASRTPKKKQLAVESPLKDAINSKDCLTLEISDSLKPKRCDTAVLKTPSPEMDRVQPTTSPPPLHSLVHAFSDDTGAVSSSPEPPTHRLIASSARKIPRPVSQPSPGIINSPLFANSVTGLTSHPFATSTQSLNTATKHAGAPAGSKFAVRKHPLFPLIPSPLGSAPIQSRDPLPAMYRPTQNIKYMAARENLSRSAVGIDQIQIANANNRALQNTLNDNHDVDGTFANYKGVPYTMRECVLVVALKMFCTHSGEKAGEKLDDDTVTEILQFQRGWRHPNGLDCHGMYVSLLHPYGNTRDMIDHVLRQHTSEWESYAWTSYRSWLNAMQLVCAGIKNQHNARHEAVRRAQTNALKTFNSIYHQSPKVQISSELNSPMGNSDDFNNPLPKLQVDPLPKLQVPAVHTERLEELSEKDAVSERHKRLNDWVANEMLTTNLKFDFASEGSDSAQRGEGINDGYLPQMEPSIDAGAFSFE